MAPRQFTLKNQFGAGEAYVRGPGTCHLVSRQRILSLSRANNQPVRHRFCSVTELSGFIDRPRFSLHLYLLQMYSTELI